MAPLNNDEVYNLPTVWMAARLLNLHFLTIKQIYNMRVEKKIEKITKNSGHEKSVYSLMMMEWVLFALATLNCEFIKSMQRLHQSITLQP